MTVGAERDRSELDRLEEVVGALAQSHRKLQIENATIRRELELAVQRVRRLDGELIAANQRRQDTGKRIDELIAHLDQLDSQLEDQERAAAEAYPDEP